MKKLEIQDSEGYEVLNWDTEKKYSKHKNVRHYFGSGRKEKPAGSINNKLFQTWTS